MSGTTINKMMKYKIKSMRQFLVLIYSLISISATAQQKDSIEAMQQFINICNAYKQVPLYLNVEYANTSNLITSPEDTSSTQAEFYIVPQGAYIKFSEMEQIVNDSMALLISGQMQRMILYRNAKPMIAQMKAMIGMQMPDASIKNLCNKYRVSTSHLSGGAESILLQSRTLLYNTSLSKETIELQYNALTKSPLRVINLQRNLIAIEQTDYNSLTTQPGFENKLLKIEDEYYAVKEKTASYTYKKIAHEATIKIPVSFDEKIVKSNTGIYIPAKAYENYVLTED